MALSQGDSYRPRYGADLGPPPSMSVEAQNAMYYFQGNRNGYQPPQETNRPRNGHPQNAPHRSNRPFKFRAPPPSERPLFTQSRLQETSKLTFGGDAAEDKFRNLEELTDTDESDMDISVDEEYAATDDMEDRPAKRSRLNDKGDAANSLPKWSNPDPYTALPPPESDTRKKTNVVHLIRKARNAAAVAQKDTVSHDDDFISFDFDDEEDQNFSTAPPAAPSGPRHDRHDALPSTLGKRSRDTFENSPLITPKFGQQHHSDGRVLEIWRANAYCDATPWIENPGNAAKYSAGTALQTEIIDFYHWVQPKDFEVAIRGGLLQRLEQALCRLHPGGKLEAFGSYAAGLYLPVGDMDLVFLERQFRPGRTVNGLPVKPNRKMFENTARFIREQGIARVGSVNPIWFAKVPIIKFIENVSGLKVDLSFNNETGVIANQTFQKWRRDYPAMPIITSIIKQFLMIRGLNDVASGGLGGFSVICLVTSLIQHMPQLGQSTNLGQILVEFFNLYGKLFRREEIAIRLDPPGYLEVANYRPFDYNNDKPDRLKIIDPNRPENNISGGTVKIGLIFNCFATAHDILQENLSGYENGQHIRSFLEQIVGGNFDAYATQREYLRELHLGPVGLRAPAVIPPPPPPYNNAPQQTYIVPPPPPSLPLAPVPKCNRSDASLVNSVNDSGALAKIHSGHTRDGSVDRELRTVTRQLKRLRPALAERADSATNMRDLANIGGYGKVSVMLSDLKAREGMSAGSNTQSATNSVTSLDQRVLLQTPNGEKTMEWHRQRARSFCPHLNTVIDGCISKAQLANACGYTSLATFNAALTKWETENGIGQEAKQHNATFNAAAPRNLEERVQAPKKQKSKKAKKNQNKKS